MSKILIVEDDMAICELLVMNFRLIGYEYLTTHTAANAEQVCRTERFDLLLLDVMLPDGDGFMLAQRLQSVGAPIIFLTAKADLSDRLRGFDLGAVDYVIKPFEMLELLARIKSVLRRTGSLAKQAVLGDLLILFDERRVVKAGQEIALTPTEYQLLETLLRNQNIAMSREKLLELVWGYEFEGDTRTVDVHITKLRKKLGLENTIRTVYKIGYRLEVPR
ncbi:DNA-binding response regulator [Butyricicoccus sp. 1XD8-22]|nr:DNA-binding response regulator [Butyricicoccus sp. 1XD8-22]